MTLDFEVLRINNINRDREFQQRKDDSLEDWTIVDRSNELAGESGEVCNLIKKIRRARLGMQPTDVSYSDVADELADVIICVDLLAMDLGIDLSKAVKNKFNESSEKFNLETKI